MVDKLYLGIIVVLVLIIAYVTLQPDQTQEQANRDHAADVVRTLYEMQYESPAEVLKTDELYGIYRMTVRFTDFNGQQQTQESFVTKDGQLLTDRFLITESYRTALDNQKKFIECMRDKNLRIIGQRNDTATIQQLDILGTYAYKLFVPCEGANEQTCAALNLTRYPVTYYNSSIYDNIYDRDFFSQLTECKLG
ncbi:MAG TPA: hypothetical protein VJB05_03460 [archaeon]|nr:hypothetical protein [archaeon]